MKKYSQELWNRLKNEYSENNEIPFEEIRPSSKKLRYWTCPNYGHLFHSPPESRFRGQNCHYCSNNKVLSGFNDLATKCPEVLPEWDYTKNNVSPEEVQPKSSKRVWWICKLGHSYDQVIAKHTEGKNCPYCTGRKILEGFNDIRDEMLIKQWDTIKNPKSIKEYTKGSNFNAYWLCTMGHSFRATIPNRINRNDGCPYCSGRRVLTGFNDLFSQSPEIFIEWIAEKNLTLNPEALNYKTTKKAWFKCSKCAYEWKTPIYNRTVLKTGCPQCAYRITVSEGEKDLANFVEYTLPNYTIKRNERKIIKPLEIDIYIPELMIGIEYNGEYWHSDEKIQESKNMPAKAYHQLKIDKAFEKGILLLIVWEKDWKNNPEKIKQKLQKFFNASEGTANLKLDVPAIFKKLENDINLTEQNII